MFLVEKNNMLEDKFSVINNNELYYKDVFIGYLLKPQYSVKYLQALNYENALLLSGLIAHQLEEDKFLINESAWLEVKNRNFNERILNKLTLKQNFKEPHTHYGIKVNGSVYLNFITDNYKKAVKQLIEQKESFKKAFSKPILEVTYEIIPLNLP